MNERIQQLASEAGLLFQRDKLSYEERKFAELIVKECLSFCEYEGDRFDEYDSGMGERARIIRESIHEHFGVEQ